ncbi:MAG: hypothetical protein ACTSX6_00355 [Candidatus Heimdallarchaeaceae archaeon]
MPLNKTTIPSKTMLDGEKSFQLTENQKIAIQIDGVDDEDLVYTVPAGKTATIRVEMRGTEE